MSASQNDDDEQKDAKDSTENSFDDHQYIDSSLYISDEDDTMEKLKRRIKQFGKKFQEAAATRKKNAAAKQKMAEARSKMKAEEEARKEAEEEAEKAEEEARMKNSTHSDYQDHELAERTGDEISDSVVMSDIHQSQPQHESQVGGQNNPMMTVVMPQKTGNSGLTVVAIVGVVVLVFVVTIILAGVLYVWANNLAAEEIEGTWYNPVQTFTFSDNGDMEDNATTYIEWRSEGNTLYLVDSTDPGYEYYYRYSISNDVLFLAPLDHDFESVVGENCSAYTKDIAGKNPDDYGDLVVRAAWPDWCTPEE